MDINLRPMPRTFESYNSKLRRFSFVCIAQSIALVVLVVLAKLVSQQLSSTSRTMNRCYSTWNICWLKRNKMFRRFWPLYSRTTRNIWTSEVSTKKDNIGNFKKISTRQTRGGYYIQSHWFNCSANQIPPILYFFNLVKEITRTLCLDWTCFDWLNRWK